MDSCIFCKIVKKEIPAEIIFENDSILAFLDIRPVNKGHVVIVSKKHFESFEKTEDSVAAELVVKARKIAPKIAKAVNADGFNFSTNNGSSAGQVVMHTHFHIIPRFKGDGLAHWPHKEFSKDELKEIKNKIVSFLKE
jgi:histidine triad (HIT) family protein